MLTVYTRVTVTALSRTHTSTRPHWNWHGLITAWFSVLHH